MHIPRSGTPDAAAIDLAYGLRVHGFVNGLVGRYFRDHRVGFAYLGNQVGGYGAARARELTAALHAAIGA